MPAQRHFIHAPAMTVPMPVTAIARGDGIEKRSVFGSSATLWPAQRRAICTPSLARGREIEWRRRAPAMAEMTLHIWQSINVGRRGRIDVQAHLNKKRV